MTRGCQIILLLSSLSLLYLAHLGLGQSHSHCNNHRAEANVSTDLRAEPHLAVADDAREGELAAVGGHVLLQPTPGAGDHVEDLAAVPQAPERPFQLGLPDLGPALVQLTDDVHSLVEKRKRN